MSPYTEHTAPRFQGKKSDLVGSDKEPHTRRHMRHRRCFPAGLDATVSIDQYPQPLKNWPRISLLALLASVALWSGGCTPIQAVIPIANTANYMAEEQLLTDKWISQWYGKQCSLANFLEDHVMCRDDLPDKIVAPIYCYNTLGKPECFESPDPFDPRRPLLGGLPQQRRQAERYQQYLNTGTRWPLKPLGQSGTPLPTIKNDADDLNKNNATQNNPMQGNNPEISKTNRIQDIILNNDLQDTNEKSDSVPANRPQPTKELPGTS